MENFCFTDLPNNYQLKLKFDSADSKKERSKTPNRDKSGSRLEVTINKNDKTTIQSMSSPKTLTRE
jgi:hypothetical protein